MHAAPVVFLALLVASSCTPYPDVETIPGKNKEPATAATPATATATATSTATGVECFCMSWVHRDENGEYCYPTRAACDENFASFGRSDKLACRVEVKSVCERIACRGSGAACFRQP